MNPEIKAQWVADLRSGEYEQGTGALNRDGKLWAGLPDIGVQPTNPNVLVGFEDFNLAELNDGDEDGERDSYTFGQIADLIDAQL